MDYCITDGVICPAAQAIIDQCGSYTEISPSGKGIRIIGYGCLPEGFKNKYDMAAHGFTALEIYDKLRYLTITGDVVGEPRPIVEIGIRNISLPQENTSSGEVKHAPLGQKNHDVLLDRIRNEKDGAKFILLYDHGDQSAYQGDQNRADMALVNILAKWSNFDTVLLDELFRGSALYRTK